MLRSLPHELGRLFQLQVLGLAGNPLCQEVMKLYSEPNGTHRLLMYLLDSLQGKIIYFVRSIHNESVYFSLLHKKFYKLSAIFFDGLLQIINVCFSYGFYFLQYRYFSRPPPCIISLKLCCIDYDYLVLFSFIDCIMRYF